jgi:predicted ABC-type ATPase
MTHEGDATKKHNRTISIVAGPNGAGKSTFVENYLNRYIDCDEFLNADLIARGLSHHPRLFGAGQKATNASAM